MRLTHLQTRLVYNSPTKTELALDDVSALLVALNAENKETSSPQQSNNTSVEEEVTAAFRSSSGPSSRPLSTSATSGVASRIATTGGQSTLNFAGQGQIGYNFATQGHQTPVSRGFASASRPGAFTSFNPPGQLIPDSAKAPKRKKGMKSKGSLVKQASGPCHLHVVLLRSPDDTTVPKQ